MKNMLAQGHSSSDRRNTLANRIVAEGQLPADIQYERYLTALPV